MSSFNGLAMAASLNTSGVSKQELEKGKFTQKTISTIKDQLRILKMNKQLSHNQITDNIYEREGHRYEEMYQLYIADKIAYEKRKNVSSVDVLGQKKKIQAMTEKGDKLKAMQEEFAAQSYFQYISMNNVIPQVNKLEINRQKLRGQFKVQIAQRIPFNEKVNAFANEELSYYLYQKGIMMKQLSKKNQKGKEKSVFDKIQHRLKLLKLKEQKIDLID